MSSSPISAVTSIDTDIVTSIAPAATDEQFVAHLMVRPRWAAATRFQAALARTLAEHPDVPVQMSGAAKNDSHLELTFGISMGPTSTVSNWSPESLAGFALMDALMNALLDYTPAFVAAPDADRAQAAVALAPRFGLSATLPSVISRAA
jgi:hypothetical protein